MAAPDHDAQPVAVKPQPAEDAPVRTADIAPLSLALGSHESESEEPAA